VTFIKSDPSLPIRAYCRHEQLRRDAQPNFGKLFSASLGPSRRLDPENVSKWIDAGRRPTSAMGEKLTSQHPWPGRLPKHGSQNLHPTRRYQPAYFVLSL